MRRRLPELACLGFVVAITFLAGLPGGSYVFFPELAALAYEVFKHPDGRWARAPWKLALSPPLAGVLGIAICRELSFGPLAVGLIVAGGLAILAVMRSPVAPAVSAGLLPLVLGIQSWWYPPGILVGTGLLALVSVPWRSRFGTNAHEGRDVAEAPAIAWLPTELLFVTAMGGLALLSGWRFLLYPPLAVVALELFRARAACPWARWRTPLAFLLTAALGFGFDRLLGPTALCAGLSVGASLIVLEALRLHAPPALAVSLLPIAIGRPASVFPVAVGLATGAAMLVYLAYERALAVRPGLAGVR